MGTLGTVSQLYKSIEQASDMANLGASMGTLGTVSQLYKSIEQASDMANLGASMGTLGTVSQLYKSIEQASDMANLGASMGVISSMANINSWPDSTSYFNNIWLNMQSLTNLRIPNLDYIGITSLISETVFFEEKDFKKFEYNWMGYFSPRIIKAFYEEFKNGNEDAVKIYFYEMFQDKNNIQKIKADLKTNDKFNSRMDLIEAGLDAHLEGRYVLSIPTLLPLIDGILIENFSSVMDGQYPEGKCPECNKDYAPLPNTYQISKIIVRKFNGNIFTRLFFEYLKEDYHSNRSQISHGNKLDYPNADYSTKLILTLYMISHLINEKKLSDENS
jgi:hypothetical protein